MGEVGVAVAESGGVDPWERLELPPIGRRPIPPGEMGEPSESPPSECEPRRAQSAPELLPDG